MKISYVFPEPLPLPRARGIQAAHTIVELARAGVDIDVYHVPAKKKHPLAEYGLEAPPNVRLVPVSRSLAPMLERPHSNRLFLSRLLRQTRGDLQRTVVLVRHHKIAALLLQRVPRIRLVYEAHEVFADTAPAAKADVRHEEEGAAVRGAAAVVCNSAATAARLTELYAPKSRPEVIPNGVDRPESLPEKDWAHAGHHIVYVGSFFPWKGAADLVAAGARLSGCRIELVGGEPDRLNELQAFIAPGGAEVVLSGRESHAHALARLNDACVAVVPNRSGTDSSFTSPIKLFEYMAHGCAIVASDLPSIRELLSDDEAEWARPDDPESLAAAIRRLVDDPSSASALGARVRQKSRLYTWAARAQKLKHVLERVDSGRP